MPYKDKEKAKEYFAQRQKTKYMGMRLSIPKDSPIPEALERMKEDLEIAPATYAQQALVVQLRKDGYLEDDVDGDEAIKILRRTGQIIE